MKELAKDILRMVERFTPFDITLSIAVMILLMLVMLVFIVAFIAFLFKSKNS